MTAFCVLRTDLLSNISLIVSVVTFNSREKVLILFRPKNKLWAENDWRVRFCINCRTSTAFRVLIFSMYLNMLWRSLNLFMAVNLLNNILYIISPLVADCNPLRNILKFEIWPVPTQKRKYVYCNHWSSCVSVHKWYTNWVLEHLCVNCRLCVTCIHETSLASKD